MSTVHRRIPRRRAPSADRVMALAREQSEALVAALVENASEIIIVIGDDGALRYQSPSLERVLGHPVAALDPGALQKLVHGDDLAGLWSGLAELRARVRGSVVTMKARVRHADGTWRHLE